MSARTWVRALFAFTLLFAAPAVSDARECASDLTDSVDPIPPKRAIAIERHQKIKASFPNTADDVIIGDSMAQRWPRKNLTALFNNSRVLNLGVRSDRTQNILWRMNDLPLSTISPSRTVLFAGTNNLTDNATPCEIFNGIAKIASELKSTWPETKLFIIQILPRGMGGFTFRSDARKETNALIGGAAARMGFKFIVVDETTLTCGSNANGTCPNFIHDQTHLTLPGYDFMNRVVAAAFTNFE